MLKAAYWGGPLQDNGVYCLNAGRHIFATEPIEAVPVRSFGNGSAVVGEVEESIAVTLRFPEGRLAQFIASFGADSSDFYHVAGTKGSVTADPGFRFETAVRMKLRQSDTSTEKTFPQTDHFAGQTAYFSDCILNARLNQMGERDLPTRYRARRQHGPASEDRHAGKAGSSYCGYDTHLADNGPTAASLNALSPRRAGQDSLREALPPAWRPQQRKRNRRKTAETGNFSGVMQRTPAHTSPDVLSSAPKRPDAAEEKGGTEVIDITGRAPEKVIACSRRQKSGAHNRRRGWPGDRQLVT